MPDVDDKTRLPPSTRTAEARRVRAARAACSGKDLLALSGLQPLAEAGRAVLVHVAPAGLLPRGDYRIKLSGAPEGGEREPVATCSFRVRTP